MLSTCPVMVSALKVEILIPVWDIYCGIFSVKNELPAHSIQAGGPGSIEKFSETSKL
jgi:hypothetical protein